MRRSKSNPAKYAKNYRSISQRRMTHRDNDDDNNDGSNAAEMERLRRQIGQNDSNIAECTGCVEGDTIDDHCSRRKRKDRQDAAATAGDRDEDDDPTRKLLSGDLLLEDQQPYGDAENPLLVLSKKRKKATSSNKVALTPDELKAAAKQNKLNRRKLQQLEQRAAQKQNRAALYAKLQQSSLLPDQQALLQSSASYSKPKTQREMLAGLLQKERAGIQLSAEEQELLYRPHRQNGLAGEASELPIMEPAIIGTTRRQDVPASVSASEKKVEKAMAQSSGGTEKVLGAAKKPCEDVAPASLAEQMMASLTTLKTTALQTAPMVEEDEREQRRQRQHEREQEDVNKKRYIPSEPVVVKTTQSYEPVAAATDGNNNTEPDSTRKPTGGTIRELHRPPEIQSTRYDLPVAAMEFEVMDAIRIHDVTIVCAETGSGKSTQVPQFLYEAGFGGMVAVTQPRRVAAVSTAKRVCYEMGQGNGQWIGHNNLVAYQTRYETAGLGNSTRIKFMTDGILLQEIQSDLLLRQYSCIVLDEAPQGLLPPLKIVIMSATLRVEDFTKNEALFPKDSLPAVVRVPGRTFPVTIHHSKVTEFEEYGTYFSLRLLVSKL
jgi:ATP-dependent RNA helicase DHX37/DHR1